MKRAEVIKAQQAAQDFVALVDELIQSDQSRYFFGSRLSGSVRRKSMDLTRALADMRKP